jgi:hypothetical protein
MGRLTMAYVQKVEDEASNLYMVLFILISIGLWGVVVMPPVALLIPIGLIGVIIVAIGVALEKDWVDWVYSQED